MSIPTVSASWRSGTATSERALRRSMTRAVERSGEPVVDARVHAADGLAVVEPVAEHGRRDREAHAHLRLRRAGGRADAQVAAVEEEERRAVRLRQVLCALDDERHDRLEVELCRGDVALGRDDRRHPLLVLGDLALGALARRDVAGEAERPDDLAALVAQRELRRRDPRLGAVVPRLVLLDVHERPAGAHDLLLVLERLRRVLGAEEVAVGVADGVVRSRAADGPREPG